MIYTYCINGIHTDDTEILEKPDMNTLICHESLFTAPFRTPCINTKIAEAMLCDTSIF